MLKTLLPHIPLAPYTFTERVILAILLAGGISGLVDLVKIAIRVEV